MPHEVPHRVNHLFLGVALEQNGRPSGGAATAASGWLPRQLGTRLLRSARNGSPGGLTFVGEPGIGKSALLAELSSGLDDAFVLRAAGSESERALPLALLNQLLYPVRRSFDGMHDHHRHVLFATIERGEPATPTVVGLALLDLLNVLSDKHALTVVVLDDVQWADEFSADVLQFAIRRLSGERVAVLLAARSGEPPRFTDVPTVELDGVDEEVARELLAAGGDIDMAVARKARLACGANPFVMQQLGATLTASQRCGAEPLPDVVPMGPALTELLQRRISGLDSAARTALVVLAAAGSGGERSVTSAWTSLGLSPADLVGSERAGVVRSGAGGYEFTHPLMQSAVLDAVASSEVRTAHRTLAEAQPSANVERRAHHLDLAADGPDEEAALALEVAARRTAKRGARELAAISWERSARRSVSPEECSRRLGESARAWWGAHRPDLGIPLGSEALTAMPQGPERAAVVHAMGEMVGFWTDTRTGAQMLIDEAVTIAERWPANAATMMAQAANLHALAGDLHRGVALGAQAESMAHNADAATQLGCRVMRTHLRLIHGEAADIGEELVELAWLGTLVGPDAPEDLVSLGRLIVFDLMTLGRWDQADDLATRVIAQARSAGLRGVESFVHGLRGEVAWRRGRWIEARAEAVFEVHFNEANLGATGSFAHATLARVEAVTGRLEASRRHASVVVDLGARLGMGVLESWGRHARGLAALAAGDADAAASDLQWIWELCQQGEIGEPGPLWWHGDLFEALWRADNFRDARRLADDLGRQASATGSDWAAAIHERARGVLDSNPQALLDSACRLETIGAPFESARSHALLGEIGPPSAFLAEVSGAHRTFSSLGARPWTERTALMVGDTTTSTPGPLDLLTRAESRVAAAVSRGLTNRDAADSLFISPRTVDAHLQHIYRKLGVSSRTELAALLNGAAPPNARR